MILVDINLLVYATNTRAPQHPAAHAWWEQQLSGENPVGLAWQVLLGFIRITTHPKILPVPLTLAEAGSRVDGWLLQPCVQVLQPAENHWHQLRLMLDVAGSGGNLVMDAHLAALAVEHDCELCTADGDFSRFPGVKWRKPLDLASTGTAN